MLKTIRIMLDYKCYPIWLYDENDNLIDTLLPEELRSDKELDSKFDEIQARYDALFIDDKHCFSYKGFSSDNDKNAFISDLNLAISDLNEKTDGKYEIINGVDKTIL